MHMALAAQKNKVGTDAGLLAAVAWLWDTVRKKDKSRMDRWYLAICTCALSAHVVFGMVYFARLLRGKGYY